MNQTSGREESRINNNTDVSLSVSGLVGVVVPLPECYPTGAGHYAQRSAQAPPGRCSAEDDELEDEGQHHVHGPHQGHGASLFYLQGLREEGLASNSQHRNQNQYPAIAATRREFPFPEDGYGDDALDEANDGIVPHREVVMGTLPNLTQDNKCKSRRHSS